ncbi:MAG: alpha-glucosidase, partial [bacterium]|nr:alpha-glucosidase [bacterium]
MPTNETRRTFIATGLAGACLLPFAARGQVHELESPDGLLTIGVTIDDGLAWSVEWNGRVILAPSRLGLVVNHGVRVLDFHVTGARRRDHDSSWTPVLGERSRLRDHFCEFTLELVDHHSHRFEVVFRAYNEGASVCYVFPEQPDLAKFTITKELTQFRFGGDHLCYPVYTAQGVYKPTRLSKVRPGCERPLTVEVDEHAWVAVTEARLVDYARMKLRPSRGVAHALEADLDGRVRSRSPYRTPWRVVMVADSPGRLLENNHLIENLNDPCAITDPSWIKPGKVIRDLSLTTTGAMACVEFAARRGLQYVEFDAGWYGPETSH